MSFHARDVDAGIAEAAELENLGFDLGATREGAEMLWSRKAIVEQLARTLDGGALQPVLLGEPGVGKSAIVTTLARVVRGDVARVTPVRHELSLPKALLRRKIILVTVPDMLSGALYVNHLEHKLKLIVSNCEKSGAILFLDNVASFTGAGSSTPDPDSDVANLLVPFLSRGALRIIAAATPEDWMVVGRLRPAFARLFTPIRVPETTPEETQAVLTARAHDWSQRYRVRFCPGALPEALDLADRLYPWKRMPGKACDVIERALALIAAEPAAPDSLGAGFDPASFSGPPPVHRIVNAANIADATRRLTGLPDFLLVPNVAANREVLTKFVQQRVVGQGHVIGPLVDRIQMLKARLCAPGRPVAAYLFAGPTGVGKTLVARTMAALLLGDERRLIRFDMSEYCTVDSVSRFLGENRPSHRTFGLVDAVLAEVFPVILLDEIEKAHRSVFDVLLQALGEGRITDEANRTAYLTNAIVLMTSNLGTDRMVIRCPRPAVDTAAWDQRVRDAVRRHFRPEFLNRLTGLFTFVPLSPVEVDAIARREVYRLAERHGLATRLLRLRLTREAFDAVLRAGYSPEFGVRPMERAVDLLVGTALGRFLAENPATTACTLVVDVDEKSEPIVLDGLAASGRVPRLIAAPTQTQRTALDAAPPPAQGG